MLLGTASATQYSYWNNWIVPCQISFHKMGILTTSAAVHPDIGARRPILPKIKVFCPRHSLKTHQKKGAPHGMLTTENATLFEFVTPEQSIAYVIPSAGRRTNSAGE